jgi:fatty-acyl-CoA synthase
MGDTANPSASPASESLSRLCSAGRPIPLVDVQVVDESMQPQAHDGQSSGEIVVRAPWLTQGYLDNPESSALLWRGDYLHTQDIGVIGSDGYLYITDRLKDVIKVAGEWVSSLEVENALASVEGVKEVAVIGVPEKRWGERPLALLVVEDHVFNEHEARNHLRRYVSDGLISKHALLTHFKLVKAIAKTSVGKIDKKTLRQEHSSASDLGF